MCFLLCGGCQCAQLPRLESSTAKGLSLLSRKRAFLKEQPALFPVVPANARHLIHSI